MSDPGTTIMVTCYACGRNTRDCWVMKCLDIEEILNRDGPEGVAKAWGLEMKAGWQKEWKSNGL